MDFFASLYSTVSSTVSTFLAPEFSPAAPQQKSVLPVFQELDLSHLQRWLRDSPDFFIAHLSSQVCSTESLHLLLFDAISIGKIDVITEMVEKTGKYPREVLNNALHRVARQGTELRDALPIIDKLIDLGAETAGVDDKGNTALMIARNCACPDADIIK